MACLTILACIVSLHLFVCRSTIHAAQNHGGLSLRLIHRHSLDSPLYRANLTDVERMEELIQISNTRVESLATTTMLGTTNQSSTPTTSLDNTIIVRPSIRSTPYLYFVQIGIGTFDSNPPFKTYYLNMDTGTDLIWTQCEGCDQCYHQVDPYFPKSQSKSYQQFTSCSQCPQGSYCKDGNCMFRRKYGDTSTVEALAAKESFTLESDNGKYVKFTNGIFGCGLTMQNFKLGSNPDNKVSGMLGMNNGPYSFVTQSKKFLQGRFSYCFQSINSQGKGPQGAPPMFLRFGDDVMQTPGMSSTPLKQVPNRNAYYLNLQDISVAKNRLNIPSQVFQVKQDGSGGCVIDSGASLSYLTKDAYEAFVNAVTKFMEDHNPNVRKMEPEMGFQMCFERFQAPDQVLLPSVSFNFENAEFYVEHHQAFFIGNTKTGEGMICSTIFQAPYDITVLGSYQQVNHRIIFDTVKSQLLFQGNDCSKGN